MGKKNHKNSPFMCGKCKQGFQTQRAVTDHIKGAHPDEHKVGIFKCVKVLNGANHDDDEPSFADRAVEAQIAMNCGEPTDDAWLLGEG